MSFVVDVDASQVEKYTNILKVAGDRFLPEMDKAVNITVNEGKRYITEKTPKVMGNLWRSFQVQRLAPATWLIYNLQKYLSWIELGEKKQGGKGKNAKRIIRLHTKPGGYHMIKNSIKEINERLALNVDVALTMLLKWKG